MSVYERLVFFMKMLRSCCEVGIWGFSVDGKLYYTSSIYDKELQLLFAASGCMDYALNEGNMVEGPFVMSDSLGLMWQGEYAELSGTTRMLVVIGPIFYTAVTQQKLEKMIRNLKLSVQLGRACKRILIEMPVVAIDVFEQYGRMLHCAITGEEAVNTKPRYQPFEREKPEDGQEMDSEDMSERRYQLEQMLLKCIEEGNRNYEQIFKKTRFLQKNRFRGEEPHLSAIITMTSFAAQCASAAIRGGVPVNTAKKIEKKYIIQAEKTTTITELMKVNNEMLEVWTDKVNEYKTDYGLSHPIREVCIYIKENLTGNLELKHLAKKFGYTEYYLSRKFKNELGIKLNDYVKEKRIEYAKVLLITSNKSVQEIGEILQWSDRSHFSRVFKGIIGVSPDVYREQAATIGE